MRSRNLISWPYEPVGRSAAASRKLRSTWAVYRPSFSSLSHRTKQTAKAITINTGRIGKPPSKEFPKTDGKHDPDLRQIQAVANIRQFDQPAIAIPRPTPRPIARPVASLPAKVEGRCAEKRANVSTGRPDSSGEVIEDRFHDKILDRTGFDVNPLFVLMLPSLG
jgi:hypothetical protein